MTRCVGVLLLLAGLLVAGEETSLLKQGNAAMNDQNWDQALELYDKALVDSPENPYLFYNKGVAQFRKGEFAKAAEEFQKAADKAPMQKHTDKQLEADARMSLGNACFMQAKPLSDGDLQQAMQLCLKSISAYEEALRLSPDNANIQGNLKNARLLMKKILGKQMEQAKQQPQQQQNQQQEQDKQNQDKQNQDKQEQNQQNQDKQEQNQQNQDKQDKQEQDKQEQDKQEQEQQNQDKQEQDKQEQEQQNQDKQDQQEQEQQAEEQEQASEQEDDADAREIIDKERQDKKSRDKQDGRGYRAVPKDW